MDIIPENDQVNQDKEPLKRIVMTERSSAFQEQDVALNPRYSDLTAHISFCNSGSRFSKPWWLIHNTIPLQTFHVGSY